MITVDSSASEPRANEVRNRRLREATRYVTRSWLPVNPQLLKSIQDRLKPGASAFDPVGLHEDIRSDFGLYAHCLRRIGESIGESGSEVNPGQLIRELPPEKLRGIFSASTSEISPHEFKGFKDVQLTRMRHSVISCSAVRVLAQSASIDSDLAAVIAMIRQLGHLFVAWNYPSSCMRAKSNIETAGVTFEEELGKLLGFNPSHLAVEVAASWCRNPEFLIGIGKSGPRAGSEAEQSEGEILSKFCRAGELLARINDPENYPGAAKDWKEADEIFREYLGPGGTTLIRSKIEELYPHYVGMAPELFPQDLSPEQAAKTVNLQYTRKLLESNAFVRRCPADLQELLTETYDGMNPEQPSSGSVNTLVTRVIPTAGFLSGCVYILDPSRMILVPRLLIGDARKRGLKAISCSCGGLRSHPVSEAFHCTTPLKQEGVVLNGDVVSHITGRFGNGDKMGVLYLEFNEELSRSISSDDRLLYFKAIRQALADALMLR